MLAPFYLAYLAISAVITVWVGRSLNRNGRVFLLENFHGNETLADSVNHLLLVGFYLVNFGFISLTLKYGYEPRTLDQAIAYLSSKIGVVILVLGLMHFFNMCALVRFRRFRWNAPAGNPAQEACHAR